MSGKPLPKSSEDDEDESNAEETRSALMEFLLTSAMLISNRNVAVRAVEKKS